MSAQTQWWQPQEHRKNALDLVEVDSGSSWPFRALMVFTFVLLLSPQSYIPALGPLRLAMLATVLAAITHGIGCLTSGRPILRMDAATKIVLVLAAWMVLMVPLSSWPGGSIEFLLGEYFKTLAVFLLLANVINTRDRLGLMFWALALMAVPLALTTIRNYVIGNFITGDTRIVGYESGLTGNPNDMALMLNLILPMVFALWLCATRLVVRTALMMIMGLLLIAIILTFSRAGFLALCVTALVYMWLLRNRPQRYLAPLVLVFALFSLPFMPTDYVDRIGTITDIEEDATGSAQMRFQDMKVATGLVLRSPIIGAGPGVGLLAMNEARGDTWIEIHNVYLQYAVDLGIPGLILFLMLFWVCFSGVQEVIRTCGQDPRHARMFYFAEALKVSMASFAVAAFFYPVAYNFYFYFIAGLALAARAMVREARNEP